MKRVLLTGPAERLDEYARAAQEAGWEAVRHALIRIEPRPFERSVVGEIPFDWVCVTSSSALPWLESARAALDSLAVAPCAVVGERTAQRVQRIGFHLGLEPAQEAAALAEALRAVARRGARVLWPRGSRTDELARDLRRAGLEVVDPIAYASTAASAEPAVDPPRTEAVFFASPSAVHAWHDLAPADERRIAIAIGGTTFDALHLETEPRFFDTISLPQPTPEALGFVLAHLDVETSP
jgi:uroporphyrinogen-III synthase